MDAKGAIQNAMGTSLFILKSYIGDLTDAELMHRPGPGCNHVAWQLGHLIESDRELLESIAPGAAPALPAGFVEQHSKDAVGSDDPAKFLKKEQYIQLLDAVHNAALAALEKTTPADLDQPSPEKFRQMFPTVGAIYVLIAAHPLMHAGQFVPVRRALGKPVVI